MPHILFVNPSTQECKGTTSVILAVPPLGLASMAAFLESKGHSVQIIDANVLSIAPGDILKHVSENPHLIGLTVNVLTIRMAVEYARILKNFFPDALLVFGGPQASTMKEKLLERIPFLDAVVMGEGEETMLAMAERIGSGRSLEKVAGVVYRTENAFVDNGPRPFMTEIDALPIPAYHLLPDLSLYRARSRATPVGYLFSSRGCHAQCTFCYRTFGNKWRARSPEKVIEEIAYLRDKYGIRQLDVLDDNFIFDKARAKRIFDLIIAKKWDLKINFQVGVRVDSLDLEMLKLMKKAGVFKFGFGIESGDEMMLRRIKKGLDLKKALHVVKNARSLGMITHGFFILGFPGDTSESMQKTIDYAKKINVHYASFAICTALPGTEMMDDILLNGKLLHDVAEGIPDGLFAMKPFFHYNGLKSHDVVFYCQKAWHEFYARPSKIWDVLTTIRSLGEFLWICRVVQDIQRTRRNRPKNL